MIEGRHFRDVEARRRTIAEAIDRYIEEELPKKRDANTRRSRLLWWREKLGHLKCRRGSDPGSAGHPARFRVSRPVGSAPFKRNVLARLARTVVPLQAECVRTVNRGFPPGGDAIRADLGAWQVADLRKLAVAGWAG